MIAKLIIKFFRIVNRKFDMPIWWRIIAGGNSELFGDVIREAWIDLRAGIGESHD